MVRKRKITISRTMLNICVSRIVQSIHFGLGVVCAVGQR